MPGTTRQGTRAWTGRAHSPPRSIDSKGRASVEGIVRKSDVWTRTATSPHPARRNPTRPRTHTHTHIPLGSLQSQRLEKLGDGLTWPTGPRRPRPQRRPRSRANAQHQWSAHPPQTPPATQQCPRDESPRLCRRLRRRPGGHPRPTASTSTAEGLSRLGRCAPPPAARSAPTAPASGASGKRAWGL